MEKKLIGDDKREKVHHLCLKIFRVAPYKINAITYFDLDEFNLYIEHVPNPCTRSAVEVAMLDYDQEMHKIAKMIFNESPYSVKVVRCNINNGIFEIFPDGRKSDY
jgi:hypothetical protein